MWRLQRKKSCWAKKQQEEEELKMYWNMVPQNFWHLRSLADIKTVIGIAAAHADFRACFINFCFLFFILIFIFGVFLLLS